MSCACGRPAVSPCYNSSTRLFFTASSPRSEPAPCAGAPLFYISRDERDEQRLEELRQLNRQTFKETGEYLSEVRSGQGSLLVALLACAAMPHLAGTVLLLVGLRMSRLLTLISLGR